MKHNRKQMMLNICIAICIIVPLFAVFSRPARASGETVNVWETTPDLSQALSQQASLSFSSDSPANEPVYVDSTRTFQTFDGVGGTLTDSSAWLIGTKLSSDQRNTLMNNLFGSSGIGLNFVRVPMGATDFTVSGNYSYDDNNDQPDPNLTNFSTSHDDAYIIPTLQQAQQINSGVNVLATPWSPPGWMKDGGSGQHSMNGGSLDSQYYSTLGSYFTRFVQDYTAKGVPVWGVAPQNEPQSANTSYPSMALSADQEANFIANYLGPDLANLGDGTKILDYDHNWGDQGGGAVAYPQQVLSNSTAASYITGTAFHCYNGDVSGQKTVQNAYPDKGIYFTECTQTADRSNPFQLTMDLVVRVTRNAGKTVMLYNLAEDTNYGPQNNGCSNCRGIVTIDQNSGAVRYNEEYYALGQISKFVQRGAYNIASDDLGSGNIRTTAFMNPDGSKVLIAYNDNSASQPFTVSWNGETFNYTLPGGAAATYVWN